MLSKNSSKYIFISVFSFFLSVYGASAKNIFHIGYLYYTDEQISQEEQLTSKTAPSILGRENESSGLSLRLDQDLLTYLTGSFRYMRREFHLQTEDPAKLNSYIYWLKKNGTTTKQREIDYHQKRGDSYYAGLTARTPFYMTFKFSFQYSKGVISSSSAEISSANDIEYKDIDNALKNGDISDVEYEPVPTSTSYNGSIAQAFFNGNTELEIGFSYAESRPVFPVEKGWNEDLKQYYYFFDRVSAYQFGVYSILTQVLTKTTIMQLIGVYATDPFLEDGREISFRINQYIVPTKSSIHFAHRYFSDTFSLRSNLFEIQFYQYLTSSTTLKLRYRYYWEDNDAFDYDTLISTTLTPDDYNISETISPIEGRLYGVKITQNLLAFFGEENPILKFLDNVDLELSYHRMTIYDKRYDKYQDENNLGYPIYFKGLLKNEGETKIKSDIFFMGLTFKY
ncbi:DUF3570 domain-containing protein [bacterium]|nr:DUF3570 domain-containing protein [bacterium]